MITDHDLFPKFLLVDLSDLLRIACRSAVSAIFFEFNQVRNRTFTHRDKNIEPAIQSILKKRQRIVGNMFPAHQRKLDHSIDNFALW